MTRLVGASAHLGGGVDVVGENASMASDRTIAQTLSRGIRILEILAEKGRPMSAQELSMELAVSRPIVYRLLRTLESHDLLDPAMPEGKFAIGLGLLTLSRRVVRDLREASLPEVTALTQRHGATSFVGVKEGSELVCVASAESEYQTLAIRHREGMRVPSAGASDIAIRSSAPAAEGDSDELRTARELGYAVSEGHVFPGAFAVAAPIIRRGRLADASITLIYPEALEGGAVAEAGHSVVDAAARISRRFTM